MPISSISTQSMSHIQVGADANVQADRSLTRLNEGEKQTMLQSRGYSEMLKERTGHHLLLTAHRGTGPTSVFGSTFPDKYLPENSLQAIKAAVLDGADAIEIDIFKSGDGKVVVTHDDEIWRNAYGADRSGSHLPEGESKASYLVGQKTVEELKGIPLGRNGETMPTLAEVMELVNDANQTLAQYGKNPIILNIELKDAGAVTEMLDLLAEGSNGQSATPLENIVFCSFKHEALKELKERAEQRGMTGINIAPGIKTADLFGKDNMNPDFSLKDPAAGYHPQAMDNLRALVEGNGFQGYDGILWDLRQPIVDLAVAGNKAIHASTSDFRQYADNRDFSHVLLELSKRVDTFFKCDNVDDARKVLLESSILLNGIGIQMMHKQTETGEDCFYFYRPSNQQDISGILQSGANKPIAYSKLGRD
ncbi:cytoplasmic glycerophosphodiester phosphodiesterase [Chromobacterium violaceum]|uniref:Cytoplasmic glycerophosphodiester phosphodiesterase n=1 Tax=Chromobacterium violaceum TaxID=536 RepID=A0AAX2M6H2_CHRVL|nr:cytoplasmic glycerophosphodiester phosphodiesterase [Chromobacterium violaceum]SUX32027.1 cytoplasmic glycerophosphodiester phosphodiesterase [Chromobacterium violaceum]